MCLTGSGVADKNDIAALLNKLTGSKFPEVRIFNILNPGKIQFIECLYIWEPSCLYGSFPCTFLASIVLLPHQFGKALSVSDIGPKLSYDVVVLLEGRHL